MPLRGGGAYQGGNYPGFSLFNIMLNLMLSHALSIPGLYTIYALSTPYPPPVHAPSIPRLFPIHSLSMLYLCSVHPPSTPPAYCPAHSPSMLRLGYAADRKGVISSPPRLVSYAH